MSDLVQGERTLKIVLGYVPGVDWLPAQIARLGLVRRYAFVLDSYRSESVDAYFDAQLYRAIVGAVTGLVAATTASIRLPSGQSRSLDALEDLEAVLSSPDQPLPEISLQQGTKTVAVLISEPWVGLGGPEPYHDSYTVALFCTVEDHLEVEQAIRRAAERLGAGVTEVLSGSAKPQARSLFARVVERLGIGALLRMP